MRCKNCGTQIPDEAQFCHKCGNSIIQPTAAQAAKTPVDETESTPPPPTRAGTPVGLVGRQGQLALAPPMPPAGYQPWGEPCPSCGRRDVGTGRFCQWCRQFLVASKGVRVAGVGQRILAYVLELPLIVLTLGIGYLIWMLFFAWPKGLTPGKQVVGLRVVKSDGAPATWGTMFLREIIAKNVVWFIGMLVLFVGWFIGAMWMIWDHDRQTLYDKMAGTFVVDEREAKKLEAVQTAAFEQPPANTGEGHAM